jgi:hypothetical protein
MKQPERFIFRNNALQHYLQTRERDILPRLLSPFVFGFYWLLLALLLLAMGIAWWGEVPVYVFGSGMLLAIPKQEIAAEKNELQALVFIPMIPGQPVLHLKTNTPILLENTILRLQINGQITRIDPGIVSPQVAKKRYKLDANTMQFVTQPSYVLHAHIPVRLPTALYAGTIVQASLQSGSQRLLSLVPGIPALLGGTQ